MGLRHAVWLLMAVLLTAAPAAGEVEWRVEKEFTLEAAPLDLATSANGEWIFVLAADGKVYVYSAEGQLNDKIEAGQGVDGIATGSQEDVVYLLDGKQKSVQTVKVDFIREINTSGSPSRGPADAPVTIVLFTDFQCPYCARLAPVLEQVVSKNPETVKLVFKNFPLRSHQYAVKAATAALAAERVGKFWEFHDQLFANYNQLNDSKINEIATTLGLDMQQFEQNMRDPAIAGQIRTDFQDGINAGVRGTPSLFVNGKMLRDRSPEGFQAAIDEALAKRRASGDGTAN